MLEGNKKIALLLGGGVILVLVVFGVVFTRDRDGAEIIVSEGRHALPSPADTRQLAGGQGEKAVERPAFLESYAGSDAKFKEYAIFETLQKGVESLFSDTNIVAEQATDTVYNEEPGVINDASEDRTVSSRTYEEVFDILWPPSYVDAIESVQDMMVEDGFISATEIPGAITTDEDIFDALERIGAYAVFAGWIDEDTGVRYTNSLRNGFTEIIKHERRLYESGAFNDDMLSGGQVFAQSLPDTKSRVEKIFEGIARVFFARIAEAQLGGGVWVTLPECYKNLSDFYPVPGFNVIWPCCNCGLFCTNFGCSFISDCGPFSVLCNVPLGCLNLICILWPNAIYDYETFTCGCG